MNSFTFKGYGRLYTFEEYIETLEEVIKELDDFEWSYYPKGLVSSVDEYPNVVYVGRFEPNLDDLKSACKKKRDSHLHFRFRDGSPP
jgi:hypothetical protein